MYGYGFGYRRLGGEVGFSILDLPSLAGWYEPDDTETTNALLSADFTGGGESLGGGVSASDVTPSAGEVYTGMCWVKVDVLTSDMIFLGCWKQVGSNDRGWYVGFEASTNKLIVKASTNGTDEILIRSANAISSGVWYQVAWRLNNDADSIGIKINDETWRFNTLSGSDVYLSSSGFRLGRESGSLNFEMNGKLDSLLFWNELKNDDFFDTLYNSGSGTAYDDFTDEQKANMPSFKGFLLNEQSGARTAIDGSTTLNETASVGSATGKIQEDVVNSGDSVYTEIDKSGNGNHAVQSTVVNQFTWDGSKSLVGNGSTRTLNLDSLQTALKPDTVGYLGGWIKPNNVSSNQYIASFANSSSGVFIFGLQMLATGLMRFLLRKTGSVIAIDLRTDNVVLANGVWCHIMVVQNSTNSTMYINGVAVAQTDTGVAKGNWHSIFGNNLNNGRLGCLNYNGGGDQFHFDGEFGQWVAGSANLTTSQVLAIYNDKKSIYV